MNQNINTKDYWERRFSSNDWENNNGSWQTASFARGQIPHFKIKSDFKGELLDFGCGTGDAMPVYHQYFPYAKLIGIDIAENAVVKCREKYGAIASFTQGDHLNVPNTDIIIASNVFEHLTDDIGVAKVLHARCKSLYIIVPYKEKPLGTEHVNFYNEHYFAEIGKYDYKVFPCVGWTQYGLKNLWYYIYLKNIFRFILRKPLGYRYLQIMFRFGCTLPN